MNNIAKEYKLQIITMNNYKHPINYIAVLLIFFFGTALTGQARYFNERYVSTQSFVNPVIINPGAVGSSEYHRVIGNYRNNWSSFPGAPKTFILGYDGDVGNNIGIGLQLVSDSNGELRTTKGQGSVSYTIDSEINKIGFGLAGEYVKHGVNTDINLINNPLYDDPDDVVNGRDGGVSYFDVSFGVFGQYDNMINYGLILPGLLNSRLDDGVDNFDNEFSYIFHVGYIWDVAGYDLTVEPSIFMKQLGYVPFHVDVNAQASFLDDRFMGGLSYTIGADEKVGFLIGTRVNSVNFYYTYNISRNDFQTYNNGGHELSVRVDLGRSDKKQMTDDDILNEVMEESETIQN